MNRQLIWSLALLGGAALIAYLLIALRPAPEEDVRVVEAPLVEAVALEMASGEIPVLASGTVQPREEVTVGVQVSGRLTYVNPAFREGGVVAAGATLLRIDESEYRNNVRSAQADVAAQDVAVLQAEEEVTIARDELARFAAREQAAQSAVAGSQILPPEGVREGASDDQPAAQTSTAGAGSGVLATREPQLRSAQAARERAAANLADAELSLSRTRIVAPFRGLVREESAAPGSLVQPGQALGSIVSTASYEVRISLTPDEAALIPALLNGGGRTPATVYYEYGGQTYAWSAYVDRANAILDSTTRNVEVFLRVPSPLGGGRLVDASGDGVSDRAPPLLLGAFVNAEITGASTASYAAVPALAVRPGNEIWLVREGKLRIQKVRVIQRSDELAYITMPGLAEGGLLVTSSLTAPIDGMEVRVQRAAVE